eukprot:1143273-Prorocentrum_minimum.AAC.1
MLDANDRKHIREAQNQADYYARKIELERRRDHELTSQLKVSEMKMMQKKRALGGNNAATMMPDAVCEQVAQYPTRTGSARIRDQALSEGFDSSLQIYKKLSKDLHEKKVHMVNVIEISNIAYEARDQAQNEIAALCAQSDKEQVLLLPISTRTDPARNPTPLANHRFGSLSTELFAQPSTP